MYGTGRGEERNKAETSAHVVYSWGVDKGIKSSIFTKLL
jgi:hypothetical protein